MNYRHAFHAGNFADVFKHVLLARMLVYLARKDKPLFFFDAHAGCGLYDVGGAQAARTMEWRDGIARLFPDRGPAAVQPLIAPYLDPLMAAAAAPTIYPGSPIIAQRLLRPQDRLVLNELHRDDAQALERAIGLDRRVQVTAMDAYAALKRLVPPRERRGLVLLDPSFEALDEWQRAEQALRAAHRRWATGLYALWYPIKDPAAADAFAARFRDGGMANVLRLEIIVERQSRRGAHDALALIGCGFLLVNPPHVLESEASVLLPWLAERLGRNGEGRWRSQQLAGE